MEEEEIGEVIRYSLEQGCRTLQQPQLEVGENTSFWFNCFFLLGIHPLQAMETLPLHVCYQLGGAG